MKQDLEAQLALGRELTQKAQQSDSSESDDDEVDVAVGKSENPWLGTTTAGDPLDDIFSGYKKFWEEHNANEKKMKKLKKVEVKQPVLNEESASEVSEPEQSEDDEDTESDDENESKFINDLFDEAEEKLSSKMEAKLSELRPKLLESDAKTSRKKDGNKRRGGNVHDANYLGFEKKAKLGDVDEALNEGDDDAVATSRAPSRMLLEEVKQLKEEKKRFMRGSGDINPESFLSVKSKHLITAVPKSQDLDDADDEFDVDQLSKANKLSLAEAFANDDIVNDFEQEAEDEAKKSLDVDDTVLPGWGNWGGHGVKARKHKFEKKAPQVKKKDRIILSAAPNEKLKKHLISSVPFPFKSVQDFEASMRLPIGRDFIPASAHQKLTLPSVVTKAGTVIEPMTEDVLVKNGPSQGNKFVKRGKKGKKVRK